VLLVVGTVLLALVAVALSVHRYRRQQVRAAVIRDLTAIAAECRDQLARADLATGARTPPLTLKFDRSSGTPAGGSYHWERITSSTPAGARSVRVSISSFPPDAPLNLSHADLLEIDRAIDDGRLDSADSRPRFNGGPVLIVSSPR